MRLGANTSDADNYQNSRAGFTKELKDTNPLAFFFNGTGAVHGRVNSWYTGTADFDLTEFPAQIYRRRGDGYYEHLFDSDFYNLGRDPRFNPWYTPDFIPKDDLNSFDLGEANAPWEGIGTGWFYSALGGGFDKRPKSKTARVPVEFDNTYDTRMRGDFAVPTLFNGNFDAVTKLDSRRLLYTNTVPGWSNHFNDEEGDLKDLTTDKLVEWSKIPNLGTYREQVGYDPKQPNYALKLDGGDKITHNNFVVPDWGVLRFNLHVQNPEPATSDQNSAVRVYLNDGEFEYELESSAFQGLRKVERESNGNPNASNDEYPAVDLRKFNPNTTPLQLDPKIAEGQSNRVGFAENGFQTFQVDIPDYFRGKATTLRFELEGNKTVFIDDVFFKSQHLAFGNPQKLISDPNGDYGQEARKDLEIPPFTTNYQPITNSDPNPNSNFAENYLIEKPQYSLSYYNDNNDSSGQYKRKVNWVSYQLNKSWVGNTKRTNPDFASDPELPFNNKVIDSDFTNTEYSRGHMAAFNDRSRNQQDYLATFLTSNVVPQPTNINKRWGGLENYLTDLAENKNKEIYIIAGGDGQGDPFALNNKLLVPDSVWKVALILDKPGQGIADINENTLAFGLYLPNTLDYTEDGSVSWQDSFSFKGKGFGLFNVRRLEEETGYNFLSNLPIELQDVIEKRKVSDIKAKITGIDSASLMADVDDELFSSGITTISPLGSFNNSVIGHGSTPNQIHASTDPTFFGMSFPEISLSEDSIFQSMKIGSAKTSSSGIDFIQVASPQISFDEAASMNVGSTQTSIPNDSFTQTATTHEDSSQISSSQISPNHHDFMQMSSPQVDIPQNNPIEVDTVSVLGGAPSRIEQLDSSEITLPRSISLQQFMIEDFPSHNSTPEIINVLNNSATNLWSDLLQPQTQLDIDFQIADLPKGQLALATITDFDDFGIPNAGTILIDHDANGVGWFIDETPLENSEFNAQNTDNYLLATAESEADGKYDLLTTVLHELSHLYGFINGYEGFEDSLETENGTTKFIGDDFEATLDGEHLDKQAHPYDLLNTHLAPGMRKLPSKLDVEILQALLKAEGRGQKAEGLDAALTSDPLLAIANGDFEISNTTTDSFAWDTRGASGIENGQAVLTEDSPFLSNFTQTFTVPEEAKLSSLS